MSKLSSRHNNTSLEIFSDFSGGLNFARPPESIAQNEMQESTNFEFAPDTGMLRVRGGLTLVKDFPDIVSDIMPIAGTNAILVRSGGKIYRLVDAQNGAISAEIGITNGNKPVSYELWSDGYQMVMSFGGSLYIYDGVNLNVVDSQDASQEIRAQKPLREASVEVSEVPGRPGVYRAVAFVRPHYQLDELSVSLRLVAEMPQGSK